MASVNAKRLLKTLLEGTKATTGYYGFGDLRANTDDLISQIYTAPEYTDQKRAELATWYAKQRIKVLGEFPRHTSQLPAIFIFRSSDTEPPKGQGVLGDGGGYDEDNETDSVDVELSATLFNEQIQMHVWADSSGASERDDLYMALREIVIRGRRYLHSAGLKIVEWTGGKDSQLFLPDRKPHVVHTAQASLNYSQFMTYTESKPRIMDVISRAVESGEVLADGWLDDDDEWA